MSKLVTGHIDVNDLGLVEAAAGLLGWPVEALARVKYYSGDGPICDLIVTPAGEQGSGGRDLGRKYNLGFRQTQDGVEVLHDNAMDGEAVYSRESRQLDATTARVVGKFKQAYNQALYQRELSRQHRRFSVQTRADGAVVLRVRA